MISPVVASLAVGHMSLNLHGISLKICCSVLALYLLETILGRKKYHISYHKTNLFSLTKSFTTPATALLSQT